jgi:Tol biopolymer transport system component
VVLALAAVVCGGCGSTGETEPAPLATQSSGPIAFLRAHGTEDPATGFSPSHELVIVDSDGGNERIVRTPGYDVESFSWSPDGRRLVFAAFPPADHRPVLYVANADGSGLRKLMQTPDHSPFPVWSPRGDMIAFDNHDDGYHAIWVINADGSGALRLTPGFRFSNPTWSPDGTRIAYEHLDEPGGYVMNADGSEKKRLTELTVGEWTRAGLTYRADGGIGFLKPDGTGRVAVEVGPEWKDYHFSPDGRTVALSGPIKPGGDFELGLARISGGGVLRLTDNDREDLGASWSPDGKSLVFAALAVAASDEDAEPPGDIYVINADGSGERNLTNSAEDESAPAWAPTR